MLFVVMYMTVFQRIRDLRQDADLNQTQAGELLGINQNTYSRYERGIQPFPIHHLITLALFYKTSVDYLVGLTDDPIPPKRKRTK